MKAEIVLHAPGAGGGLSVKCMRTADAPRWDRFVADCPQAGFFHQSAWAGILEEMFGFPTYFLLAERAGAIEGVLPLALVDSWLTERALVSLPFCIEAGVAANTPAAHAALEAEAVVIARQLGVAHLELRHRVAHRPQWPTQSLYVRFAKPILDAEEDNLFAIPRKQRAVVRKGMGAGLRAVVDPDTARFYRLYEDNMRRHGSPGFSSRYFDLLRQTFGDCCEVLMVEDPRGAPLSGVLSFYFRDTVLPYYAGDVPAARVVHANDFKYWALMQHARSRGARCFDYGRSKVGSGSYAFKKNWGCEPQPLFYEFQFFKGQTAVPQHNPANPKYRWMIAAWRHLPRPLVRFLGPRVVRHFV